MKKHHPKFIYLFIFLFILVYSCTSSDGSSSPDQTKLYLSRIESRVSNNSYEGTDSFDFVYDAENRLIKYDYQSSDMFNYSKSLYYSNDELTGLGDFTISSENNVITLISSSRKEEYFIENERVVKYKWYRYNNSVADYILDVTNEFTYDGNFKNVIKTEQFDLNGELFAFSTYKYDNKKNPFSSFQSIFNLSEYVLITSLGSENNTIHREDYHKSTNFQTATVATYAYDYNSSNYPTGLTYNYIDYNLERDFIYK